MPSLKWVKVYTSLLHNARFKKLSERARWTFVACLLLAGDLGGEKELLIQGWGPVTVPDVAANTGIPEKAQAAVLDELVQREFLSISPHGAFVIEKWDEMAGEESRLKSNRDRQKRHRKRNALRNGTSNGTVTRNSNADVTPLRNGDNVTDIEIEKELVSKDTGETPEVAPSRTSKGPSLGDMAAYKILDAAWPVISSRHTLAITRKAWRSHNKRAAAELVEVGKTSEDVLAMLEVAYEHPEGRKFYSGITTLAKLQEHWPKLAAIDEAPEDPAALRKRVMRGDFLPRL